MRRTQPASERKASDGRTGDRDRTAVGRVRDHPEGRAIGFVDALVIGLAATSPAYSLAAVLGPIVALVGVYAPGVLLASFVPMLLIASAFYYLNKVDQDCGTTFSWVTRAMGPWFGWIGGWAITMTGVLVIGSLAEVGVRFGLLTVGLDTLADTTVVVICGPVDPADDLAVRARHGPVGSGAELADRAAGRGPAGVRRRRPGPPAAGGDPALDGAPTPVPPAGCTCCRRAALTSGLLLGVFAYWGWESAVNLTEETDGAATAPGKAGVLATVILLVTYVSLYLRLITAFVGTGLPVRERRGGGVHLRADRHRGDGRLGLGGAARRRHLGAGQHADDDHPGVQDGSVDGPPACAARPLRAHSTRATAPPTCRPGGWPASPSSGTRHGHPDQRERLVRLAHGAVPADRVLLRADRCGVRRLLPPAVRPRQREGTFLFIGLGPLAGAALLVWLLVLSVRDMSDPENSYTGQAWFGVGPPLVIGVADPGRRRRPDAGLATPGRRVLAGARRRRRPGPRRPARERGAAVTFVLGYDESPGAERALAVAVDLAGAVLGEPLVLVYGVDAARRRRRGVPRRTRTPLEELGRRGDRPRAGAGRRAPGVDRRGRAGPTRSRPQALLEVAERRDAAHDRRRARTARARCAACCSARPRTRCSTSPAVRSSSSGADGGAAARRA